MPSLSMKDTAASVNTSRNTPFFLCSHAAFKARRTLGAVLLTSGLLSLSAIAQAQEAAGPEVSPQIEQSQTHNPAPATDTFGRSQFILSGDPLVPPRDYAKSLAPIQVSDYPANSAGAIYDVAFLGIENGQMQFEVRSYAANDLVYPATGQSMAFPATPSTITIRDLIIDIEAVEPGSLTYTVRPMAQAR